MTCSRLITKINISGWCSRIGSHILGFSCQIIRMCVNAHGYLLNVFWIKFLSTRSSGSLFGCRTRRAEKTTHFFTSFQLETSNYSYKMYASSVKGVCSIFSRHFLCNVSYMHITQYCRLILYGLSSFQFSWKFVTTGIYMRYTCKSTLSYLNARYVGMYVFWDTWLGCVNKDTVSLYLHFLAFQFFTLLFEKRDLKSL